MTYIRGSYPVVVHGRWRPAHAADQRGGDPFGVDERLVGRDVGGEVALMHTTEPCAGYLDYPFENEQGNSCLDTLARDKWMEEKFG
jgi:hypothetical protein